MSLYCETCGEIFCSKHKGYYDDNDDNYNEFMDNCIDDCYYSQSESTDKDDYDPNNNQYRPTFQEAYPKIQQNTTEQKPKYVVHISKNCMSYCQQYGSDDKCALLCSKCKIWGHPSDLCGEIYCCKCDSTGHKFCDENKINK